jgi:hypothetical protein
MTRHRTAALAVVPLLLLALTACGSDATDTGVASANNARTTPSPTKTLDVEDAMLKFAQCMRQHGVNIPDPVKGKPSRIGIDGGPGSTGDKAVKACQKYMQGGGNASRAADPKIFDQLVKFAQCMREHGIDMPDPKPGQGIQMLAPKGSKAKADAATKACQKLLPGEGKGAMTDEHSDSGSSAHVESPA